MTTATMEKAAAYKETHTGVIPLSRIDTHGNFRRTFDAKKLQELSDNIKRVGVLQPVLLREKDKGTFWLIAGERRIRAAKMAGLTGIPARVLDVTEDQAAEIQALENLHRADLNPIEEAQAFKTLRDNGGYEVEALAERIGKSTTYIYRAIRLLELMKDAQDLVASGRMVASAGHQLLRTSKEAQAEFVKAVKKGEYPTTADLAEAIDRAVGRDLARAPFPKDKEYAEKIACSACPHNSGNQGMLFDGAKKGQCSNAPCFDTKMALFVGQTAVKEAEKIGIKSLGVKVLGYGGEVEGVKGAMVMPDTVDKKLIAENPDKFAVAGVVPRYQGDKPKVRIICLEPSILPKEIREGKSPQEVAASKKANAEKKRNAAILVEMYQEIGGMLKTDPGADEAKLRILAIVQALDNSYRPRAIWDAFGVAKKGSTAVERKELEKLTAPELERIAFLLAVGGLTDYEGRAQKVYADLGFRMADIRARATKAVAAKVKPVKKC